MYATDTFLKSVYPKQLSSEETIEKLSLGSLEARKEIVEHHLQLIEYVAKKFSNMPYDLEELMSIGFFGLNNAINHFDANKNTQFNTYAARCIENEILLFMRAGQKHRRVVSLDKVINEDSSGNELKVEDTIPDNTFDMVVDYEQQETYRIIRQMVYTLSPRDCEIILKHYGFDCEPMSQPEIAESLGLSQSYVSRVIRRTLNRISLELQKQGLIEISQSAINSRDGRNR